MAVNFICDPCDILGWKILNQWWTYHAIHLNMAYGMTKRKRKKKYFEWTKNKNENNKLRRCGKEVKSWTYDKVTSLLRVLICLSRQHISVEAEAEAEKNETKWKRNTEKKEKKSSARIGYSLRSVLCTIQTENERNAWFSYSQLIFRLLLKMSLCLCTYMGIPSPTKKPNSHQTQNERMNKQILQHHLRLIAFKYSWFDFIEYNRHIHMSDTSCLCKK